MDQEDGGTARPVPLAPPRPVSPAGALSAGLEGPELRRHDERVRPTLTARLVLVAHRHRRRGQAAKVAPSGGRDARLGPAGGGRPQRDVAVPGGADRGDEREPGDRGGECADCAGAARRRGAGAGGASVAMR